MQEPKHLIVPVDGARVIDPDRGDVLPPEGREVLLTTFWRRRLEDGSCTIKTPAQKGSAKPSRDEARQLREED